MELSYQEKSILGSLLAMVLVYGYYFSRTLNDIGRADFEGRTIGRLIFTVIAIVVIETVYHIALALESKPEPKDERDIRIEGKAYRNAYFAAGTGSFLVILCVIMEVFLHNGAPTRNIVTPFFIANVLLLSMVLTELVKLLTQLFYYQKGV
jgi:hypothetical protein